LFDRIWPIANGAINHPSIVACVPIVESLGHLSGRQAARALRRDAGHRPATQLTDVEHEQNGLLRANRESKLAPEDVCALHRRLWPGV
jgi:hypothetical protein